MNMCFFWFFFNSFQIGMVYKWIRFCDISEILGLSNFQKSHQLRCVLQQLFSTFLMMILHLICSICLNSNMKTFCYFCSEESYVSRIHLLQNRIFSQVDWKADQHYWHNIEWMNVKNEALMNYEDISIKFWLLLRLSLHLKMAYFLRGVDLPCMRPFFNHTKFWSIIISAQFLNKVSIKLKISRR